MSQERAKKGPKSTNMHFKDSRGFFSCLGKYFEMKNKGRHHKLSYDTLSIDV